MTDRTAAGSETLIFGVNTFPESRASAVYKDDFYFESSSAATGYELWKLDSTGTGRILVKDISPGVRSSDISVIVIYDSMMFFSANMNDTIGLELWKSDGTSSGTQMVKDINPSASSEATDLILFEDNFYFKADDGTNGMELWKSDGTAGGTSMVSNIGPGSRSGLEVGAPMLVEGSSLFFVANDSVTGTELWILRSCKQFSASASQSRDTLTANVVGASYKWLDCNNNFSVISGDTSMQFIPKLSGSYAVEINENGCVDTSACIAVTIVGLEESQLVGGLQLYPNPSNGYLTIKYSPNSFKPDQSIMIYNLNSQLVYERPIQGLRQRLDLSVLSNGIYFIRYENQIMKLVIQK